jgi:hypothetical protein
VAARAVEPATSCRTVALHAAAANALRRGPYRCGSCCCTCAGGIAPRSANAHMHRVIGWLPTLARPRLIRLEFAARIVVVGAVHGLVTAAVDLCFGLACNEPPSARSRYPGTVILGQAPRKNGAANGGGPAFVTEILMSLSRRGSIIAALFPKEQVPASTPIPPARSGPSFFSSIVAFRGLN